MAKLVKLDPIAQETEVQTNGNLLSVLLANELNVLKECGGRGLCATCHIFIKAGMECLSPMSPKEQRTLGVITTASCHSRLACQARVRGDGVVVQLPSGMYVNAIQDVDALIGRRAEQDILHPLTGKVLVETGKLITRSVISQLKDQKFQVEECFSSSQAVSAENFLENFLGD
ncbi:MAG: 2Fe-2S iron-sulfur cluster binding domain-containing protein [Cyanothece sp. SIO1E1]|nr:2Fe-2S iron-sulfur cluster binding domain-containing protein [Cyanothece sp. SIO1E1]